MNPKRLPFERISLQAVEANLAQHGSLTSVIGVCGFFLCRRGYVRMLLNGKEHLLRAGDLYLHTAASFVSLVERSPDLEGLVVKSSLDAVLPFVEKSVTPMDILSLYRNPCSTLSPRQIRGIDQISTLLEERQAQLDALPWGSPGLSILRQQVFTLTETFFYELLYHYFHNQGVRPQALNGREKVFGHFMLSLMQHYKREREVLFYAREQCLTPRYFSAVVKERSGHTASEWITELVVSYASQLLTYSDKSVKEIAMELNFPTQSFFGKYFKQHTRLSPKAFRLAARERAALRPAPPLAHPLP